MNENEKNNRVSPFNNMIEELFNQTFEGAFNQAKSNNVNTYPPTSIYYDEKNKSHIFYVNVAAYDKEEIKVQAENDILIVYTERKKDGESNIEKETNGFVKKFSNVSRKNFKNSWKFELPIEKVDAKIENGILKLIIDTKKPENNSIDIKIK